MWRIEAVPFLRFEAAAQEVFDAWRDALEHRLRAEEDHPVLLSHVATYRSLMASLALILHLIDGVDAGTGVPVSRAAAAQAAAWCEVGLEPRRSARGNGGVICRWCD